MNYHNSSGYTEINHLIFKKSALGRCGQKHRWFIMWHWCISKWPNVSLFIFFFLFLLFNFRKARFTVSRANAVRRRNCNFFLREKVPQWKLMPLSPDRFFFTSSSPFLRDLLTWMRDHYLKRPRFSRLRNEATLNGTSLFWDGNFLRRTRASAGSCNSLVSGAWIRSHPTLKTAGF